MPTIQNCEQFKDNPKRYRKCMALNTAISETLAKGGLGNPWGEEIAELFEAFAIQLGLSDDVEAPVGIEPDMEILLDVIEGLRDYGELVAALHLNDVLTSLLVEYPGERAGEWFAKNLETRAKILNGLGRSGEVQHTLDMLSFTTQLMR